MNSILYELQSLQAAAGQLNFETEIISLFNRPRLSKRALEHLNNLSDGQDLAKYIQNELNNKGRNKQDRIDFMTSLSTMQHEQKHWHDLVGTSLGFQINNNYMISISRTIMACRALSKKTVKLPLSGNIFRLAGSPHKEEFYEHKKKINKFYNNKLFQINNINCDIRSLRFDKDKIPFLKDIPFSIGDNIILNNVPLLGISLLEASAVLSEVYFHFDILGSNEASEYLSRYEHPEFWIYNSVIKAIGMVQPEASVELMLAIISNSLIYDISSGYIESNPVNRFQVFLAELKQYKEPLDTLEQIEEWITTIIKKQGWSSPGLVASKHIDFCDFQFTHSEKILSEENRTRDVFEEYQTDYYRNQQSFFKKYKENCVFWASEYFYTKLPQPSIIMFDDDIHHTYKKDYINLITTKDSAFAWFFLIEILDQLKNKPLKDFCCPLKGKKNCKLQDNICGTLPLRKWPDHPDCWFFIAACDVVLFDWHFRE